MLHLFYALLLPSAFAGFKLNTKRYLESKHSSASELSYSFLYATRNDQYNGNSTERLCTSLHALISNLHLYKLEPYSEVILVDWGSPIPLLSNPLIHTLLTEQFKPGSVKLRFIRVPENVTQFYTNGSSMLSEVHALNAAARRARGEVIFRLDQDTIPGNRFLYLLLTFRSYFHALSERLYWSCRRETGPDDYFGLIKDPVEYVGQQKAFPIWNDGKYCHDGNGAVGVFGVPRAWWFDLNGYDETLIGWGYMEVEFSKRLSQYAHRRGVDEPWIDIGIITSIDFYHIFHTRAPKIINPNKPERNLTNKLWGLEGLALEEDILYDNLLH